MKARQILRKLYSANIFSLLLLVKFGFLIAYSWALPQQRDLFGEYTLAIGLTNSFFIFAGMRARFYVMKAIRRRSQLFELCLIMGFLGVAMWATVFWLNRASDILLLILLVGSAKFLEMFLDADTSYIQNANGRDTAFRILNQHGFMAAIAFVLLIPIGLEWAVLAEIALLLVTVTRQWLTINRSSEDTLSISAGSIIQIARGGFAYTLGAALNSAQLTAFLYFAQASYATEVTLLISKIFALQAVFGRLITGNNFYFKNALDQMLRRFSRHLIAFSALAALTLAVIALGIYYLQLPERSAVIVMGALFTLVNVVSLVIRQHVMVVAGVDRLIYLHAFELTILLVAMLLVPMTPYAALALLTALRLLRLNDMKRTATATDGSTQDTTAPQPQSAPGDTK